MTRKSLILIAAAGSLALLAGAFGFQLMGIAPCKLCIWQRWPHGAAVALGLIALVRPDRWVAALGALAASMTGAIGVYHTGVERGWWPGPDTCTSGPVAGMSPEDLLNHILDAPLIRCDEVAWSLFGLSMASWNAILSFVLAAIWVSAYRTARAA